MAERKKILVIGLGYFMRELVKSVVSTSRPCIAIDISNTVPMEWPETENFKFFTADATSIVLWKKLPLDEISHIIFSLPDGDVAEEICRLAREIFHLDIPIIGIYHKFFQKEIFAKYNITVIDPLSSGLNEVKKIIEKNYAVPSNIGLGKDEIVEVSVVRRSHLIGRRLRLLGASRWKVAAIYRDSQLVLPDGDSILKTGDKVVLVGEPKILSNIANLLMQGVPQFPQQYGQFINIYMDKADYRKYRLTPYHESVYLQNLTQAVNTNLCANESSIKAFSEDTEFTGKNPSLRTCKSYKDDCLAREAGIITVPAALKFTVLSRRIVWMLKNMTVPVLFSRGGFPYSHIITVLNSANADDLLQISQELSRLSNLPLKLLFVTAPKTLRNAALENTLNERQALIREFEGIDRIRLDYTVKEGNPVRETEKFVSEFPNALIVMGNNPKQRVGPLEAHIPFLTIKRIKQSVLVIPE